jgi:hypothetical protein
VSRSEEVDRNLTRQGEGVEEKELGEERVDRLRSKEVGELE